MSLYARQSSVTFRPPSNGSKHNGIHRFRRPPTNGGATTNHPSNNESQQRGEEALYEPPIEGSIDVNEEYPFSQITMSQGSGGENSFFSLRSSAVNAAVGGAHAGGAHANRAAHSAFFAGGANSRSWRNKKETRYAAHSTARNDTKTGEKDDETVQSSQPLLTPLPPKNLNGALARTEGGLPSASKRFSSLRDPPAATPRRDKRARIQHPTLTMRPPPTTELQPLLRQFPRRTPVKYSFNSSLVARSANVVRSVTNAAMTPLRTFRLRSGMGTVMSTATTPRLTSAREEEEKQPSPLDRPARRFAQQTTQKTFEEEESVVECSVPIKQNGIPQFQLSNFNEHNEDDDDDANTKTSASTYDPMGRTDHRADQQTDEAADLDAKPKTEETTNETVPKDQLVDVLSQIQNARREMEETKRALEEQHQSIKMEMESNQKKLEEQRDLMERKHVQLMEEAESLSKQRREVMDLVKGDISKLVDDAAKEIEARAKEVKDSIESIAGEVKSCLNEGQEQLCQLTNDSKREMSMEVKKLVDESKARIQVCGKLEVEALENKGRAFKNEMQEWVEGAQSDLKTMHQRAIENIQKELRDVVATAEDVKMGLKKRVEDEVGTVVAGAKDCFDAWTRELKDGQCTEYGVDDNREVVKNGSEGSKLDLLNKENQKPSFGDSSKVISSPMMDSSSRLDCPFSSSLKSPGDEPVKDETIAKNAIEKDVGSVGYKFRKLFNDGWFDGEVVEIRPLAKNGKDRRVVYSDGDSEDLTLCDLQELAKLDPKKNNNSKPSCSSPDSNGSSLNSADDEDSLLNNASLAPAPFSRKKSAGQNKPTNAISSAYSTHSELRTGLSVSTTPFSKKATPRIQNSYTKNKRLSLSSEGHSRKKTATPIEIIKPPSKNFPTLNGDGEKKTNHISNAFLTAVPTKDIPPQKAARSNALMPSASKKRSYSAVNNAIKSPRRSKRLRESARVEQKRQETEEVVEASSEKTQDAKPTQVTPKDPEVSPPTKSNNVNSVLSPLLRFNSASPMAGPASSNETDDANDEILGTSVVVNADENPDVDLDGCESIVQRDVGPLNVPWGNRNSAKSRKSMSSYGRKREKKSFAFDTLSSIFEFKF